MPNPEPCIALHAVSIHSVPLPYLFYMPLNAGYGPSQYAHRFVDSIL